MWPLIVGAGIAVAGMAASAMGNAAAGRAKAQAYEDTAVNAYNTAITNADNIRKTGEFNALSIGAAGRNNAMETMLAAGLSSTSLRNISRFNQQLQKATTEFNISLLADELPKLLDQANLQITQIWQEEARTEGAIRAFQAASGTVLDEGSNKDVIIDSRTEALMDAYIVGLQYQWNVEAVYDEIAKNAWDGQMAINKMAYEADVTSRNMVNQAALDAFTITSNATLNAFGTLNNAYAAANTETNRGISQYNTYMSQASAARQGGEMAGLNAVVSMGTKIGMDMAMGAMSRSPAGITGGGGGGSYAQASPLFEDLNQGSFYASAESII